MSPAQKLGLPHWLPPFCWSEPWKWFVYTLLIDAGVLFVCWFAIERIWHRQYFYSNLIGDTLGLPLIAWCVATVLAKSDHRFTSWYTSKWWFGGLFAALTIGWLWHTFHDFSVNRAQRLAPASVWHTTFWSYFAFIMLAAAPPVLVRVFGHPGRNLAPLVALLAGLAIWGGTYARDVTTHPPPLGGGVEFNWTKFFQPHPAKIRVDQWLDAGKTYPQDFPGWFHRYYLPDGTPR